MHESYPFSLESKPSYPINSRQRLNPRSPLKSFHLAPHLLFQFKKGTRETETTGRVKEPSGFRI